MSVIRSNQPTIGHQIPGEEGDAHLHPQALGERLADRQEQEHAARPKRWAGEGWGCRGWYGWCGIFCLQKSSI